MTTHFNIPIPFTWNIYDELAKCFDVLRESIPRSISEGLAIFPKNMEELLTRLSPFNRIDDRALQLLRDKRISWISLLSFLKSSLSIIARENLTVKEVALDYYEDPEIENWKEILITFKICSHDYNRLLNIWTKISKSKPRDLSSIFIVVEPC